ncbi:bud neck involved protein [Podospora pseudocomata]|uniref:Bud neck involved protein n=1 Tax=Podospora pseudocomata TaxID=2093779 RepID=A0ABR0G4I5_9PEZI|nr:bud neck involved protein [Podospora pseudocomata]
MAALVQGYPQQSGTVTMLQTRPASASGMLPVQSNAQYAQGGAHRNSIHGLPTGVASPVVYRGGSGSVQPYAYTGTPSLNPTTQWQQVRSHRTSSSPAVPTIQTLDYLQPGVARSRYAASNSMTNLPSTASISLTGAGSRDDSALPSSGTRRAGAQASQMNGTSLSPPIAQAAPRVSPERYRRTALRSSDSAGSGLGKQPQETATAGRPGHTRSASDQKPVMLRTPQLHQMNRPNSYIGSVSGSAIDDMGFVRGQGQEEPRRTRRRSLPALDSAGFSTPLTPPELKQPELPSRPDRPASAKVAEKKNNNPNKTTKAGSNKAGDRNNSSATTDARLGSSDSRSSGRSAGSNNSRASSSSANRSAKASNPTGNPAPSSSSPSEQTGNSQDYPRLVNIPPRSSSSDAATPKRAVNSSPLSKAMGTETENGVSADAADSAIQEAVKPTTPRVESPAARQLAAINEKGGKPKNKTSRLRRAFSFGSAAEFRKAVHANSEAAENGPGKLQKEQNQEDAYETEQARIAQRQEEAGIGSNIYGGRLFSGSTDNLSISSTASSASIMIRKMGRGMKKGGRSLVGLFRPKSIIGVPAADARMPEAMEATVSMVNVEAERERVNVNADPRTQSGGGTGFPRLERNSIDAANVPTLEADPRSSTGTDSSAARKSIVGGEKERAEVLAAVRKGILKKDRNGSASPSPRVTEPPHAPNVTDSPTSSAPSTPNDEQQGHRRTAPVTIGSEDYFVSALRLRQDTKSAPGTPQGSLKRNATFSPRIITFETWPSGEYDRRGDIATCNRLTPMLAQQIKEELNTFKMEMEVHENSKIYTHFF